MLTICWAAKGGSGTSVVAASLALSSAHDSLLVDLAGDLPLILGLPAPDTPGLHDWLTSDAPVDRLAAIESPVRRDTALVHGGAVARVPIERWRLATAAWATSGRDVIVDAGTRPARRLLEADGCSLLLVTRPCYLSVTKAATFGIRPSGIVLVDEPGRSLRGADIEMSLGAPIVATVPVDPAVARAVDSGLLASRLPTTLRRTTVRAA